MAAAEMVLKMVWSSKRTELSIPVKSNRMFNLFGMMKDVKSATQIRIRTLPKQALNSITGQSYGMSDIAKSARKVIVVMKWAHNEFTENTGSLRDVVSWGCISQIAAMMFR